MYIHPGRDDCQCCASDNRELLSRLNDNVGMGLRPCPGVPRCRHVCPYCPGAHGTRNARLHRGRPDRGERWSRVPCHGPGVEDGSAPCHARQPAHGRRRLGSLPRHLCCLCSGCASGDGCRFARKRSAGCREYAAKGGAGSAGKHGAGSIAKEGESRGSSAREEMSIV